MLLYQVILFSDVILLVSFILTKNSKVMLLIGLYFTLDDKKDLTN